jgi:hypothetical protein
MLVIHMPDLPSSHLRVIIKREVGILVRQRKVGRQKAIDHGILRRPAILQLVPVCDTAGATSSSTRGSPSDLVCPVRPMICQELLSTHNLQSHHGVVRTYQWQVQDGQLRQQAVTSMLTDKLKVSQPGTEPGLQPGEQGPGAQELDREGDGVVAERGVAQLQRLLPGVPHAPADQLHVRLAEQRGAEAVRRPGQPASGIVLSVMSAAKLPSGTSF